MEQLLQRYIRGEVSEEERLKVASWLDESPENMREFLALRKLYDLSLWQSDTNEKYSVRKRHFSIQKITIELLKIAAIFLVGFWGSKQLLTQQPDKAQMQTIHVPAGQRADIIRKTKCFDFWERNVLFPKTKRSFFRTPTLPFSA